MLSQHLTPGRAHHRAQPGCPFSPCLTIRRPPSRQQPCSDPGVLTPHPCLDAPRTHLCSFTAAFAVCPGSLLLFGTFSILLNVFQIGYSVIQINCKSKVEIVFPSIEILFVATQVMQIPPSWQLTHSLLYCWGEGSEDAQEMSASTVLSQALK